MRVKHNYAVDLLDLYEYQSWADSLAIRFLKDMTEEDFLQEFEGYISIKDRINHITLVLETWYLRLTGFSPVPLPDYMNLSTKEIIEKWQVLNIKLFEIYSQNPKGTFRYETSTGEKFEDSLENVGFHIINHTTFYRSQIIFMLRLLGKNVQNTDYILYKRNAQ